MQIQITAPKCWVASEPVDFRKAIDGLSELVAKQFQQNLEDHLFIFYNRARNKLKLLAYHRNGAILVYKRLDKKKFTLNLEETSPYEITEKQLSWLLAELDWIDMSGFSALSYEDYF